MLASSCARCRLRGWIRGMEMGRRRASARPAMVTSYLLQANDSTATTLRKTMAIPGTRALSTTPKREKRLRPSRPPRDKRDVDEEGVQQASAVEILEGLYTSGAITLAEWRGAVEGEVGMGRKSTEGQEDTYEMGVEDRVRNLWGLFGSRGVPAVLLTEEERVVGERLFGGLREVEVQSSEDEEAGVGVDVDEGGTGVVREDGEEVRFDEDEVEWLDENSDEEMVGRIREAQGERDTVEETEEEESDSSFERSHPLTAAHRFATSPSTLSIPDLAFVQPVEGMLSNISSVHIAEKASSIFGGPGLPYSTSTPTRLKTMQPKSIALDAYQGQMSEMEGDVYMSAIMPGVYSSVMSTLVETRKRMGTAWAEGLVKKAEAGELKILDAGGAGAGVLAVREVLRAEWERMHEGSHGDESLMGLAELDGKAGGEGVNTPTGKATVLTGSKTLEKRVSRLFENTTFVPRLPDYLHTTEASKKGKFDLVIAPHTLWPLREDFLRKAHVQNLWSLLSSEGGVLVLLEKGAPRGFELVAGAREMLLEKHVSTTPTEEHASSTSPSEGESTATKEPGQIIAPCTNHSSCPMYVPKTSVRGRRDICSFEQRFHRPPFLQRIFGTKGRNHEDVEFSYLSIMRGPSTSSTSTLPEQSERTTTSAFTGLADQKVENVDGRSLPRMVMPPMKRKGHVILDLCCPSGKLERWTVPRSFSKTAYRDARKANWGDLWALGAKTRIPRNVVVKGRHPNSNSPAEQAEIRDIRVGRSGKAKYANPSAVGRFEGGKFDGGRNDRREFTRKGAPRDGLGNDDFGRVTVDGHMVGVEEGLKGKVRGRKVKGIREKRDKKGDGRGRRKGVDE